MVGHTLGNLRNGQQPLERSQALDSRGWDKFTWVSKRQEDLPGHLSSSSHAALEGSDSLT